MKKVWLCWIGLPIVLAVSGGALQADDSPARPGFVDGRALLDIAGEEAVSMQVSLHRSLLQALSRADQELAAAVSGLESIDAIVLSLEDPAIAAKAKEQLASIERRLRREGWAPTAMLREGSSHLTVLVLNDEERIQGLVVLGIEDGQMIFANVSGSIDLAALEQVGDELELPGLDEIGDE